MDNDRRNVPDNNVQEERNAVDRLRLDKVIVQEDNCEVKESTDNGNGVRHPEQYQERDEFFKKKKSEQNAQKKAYNSINWDILNQAQTGDAFQMSEFGKFIYNLASNRNMGEPIVNYVYKLNAILIHLGKAHILYIMGLNNVYSPLYTMAAEMDASNNMYNYAYIGNILSQFTSIPNDPSIQNRLEYIDPAFKFPINANTVNDESFIVVYEDDITYKFSALCAFISKCVDPSLVYELKDEEYYSCKNSFTIIDSKTCNDATREATVAQIKNFVNANSPSQDSLVDAHYIAFGVTQPNEYLQNLAGCYGMNPMMGGYGMNPMMGGMNPMMGGMNPYMNAAFGSNGGYGINPQQNYTPMPAIILCAAKYSLTSEMNSNNEKIITAHIYDLVENGRIHIDHALSPILIYFAYIMRYKISIELDVSKIDARTRSNISDLCYPANINFMMGGYGIYPGFNMPSGYTSLVKYVHKNSIGTGSIPQRIDCKQLTLPVFAKMHPDIAGESKFPKTLVTQDEKVRFEDFKKKAGYIKVINAGRRIQTPDFNKIMMGYQRYMNILQASSQNISVEEMENAYRQQQNSCRNNQTSDNGCGSSRSNSFGGMKNNCNNNYSSKYNSNNYYSGTSNYGMNPMMGGYGMNPMMGGMNPMMGGMNPMMGGYGMNPMMGGIPGMRYAGCQQYPTMQGTQSAKVKPATGSEPKQGNPYANANMMNPMMGGMNPYMGGYGMNPMMGGMSGMNMGMGGMNPSMYTPGQVANGAFPGNTSGGYIPS